MYVECSRCLERKPQDEFYVDRQKRSGYRPRCKVCDGLLVDKAARRIYEKKYWDKRRGERREMILKSHNKNKDHYREQRRKYLKTEGGLAMYRKQTQTRYAKKKAAFVDHVDPHELFNSQEGICYLCQGSFKFSEMECDHVIPIARGGKHEPANCKMACSYCNRSKGSKLLEEVSYPVV